MKPVLSVDKHELAINAFLKMHEHKVSALAVTDKGQVRIPAWENIKKLLSRMYIFLHNRTMFALESILSSMLKVYENMVCAFAVTDTGRKRYMHTLNLFIKLAINAFLKMHEHKVSAPVMRI